jgi:hypothetical protein
MMVPGTTPSPIAWGWNMSGTISSGRKTGPEVTRRRGGRGWVITGVVAVVVAAAVIVAAATGVFKGSGSPGPGAAGTAYHTSIATVKRETLTSQSSLSGTLADSGSYTIVNQATGTVTTLPAVGKTVRQGGVLYQVSGNPVVLLYGNVADYRDMSAGLTGADVREFNKALIALGYTTRADVLAAGLGMGYFGAATTTAWEDYQTALGVTVPSATVTLGQVVFLPTAAKISAWETGITPGASAAPGTALMTATSPVPQVTINLDPSLETEIKAGDKVEIDLPEGGVTTGVVTQVSKVASTNDSGVTSVPVYVSLDHPKAAKNLSSAPVTVKVTTGSVANALVVPVAALMARPGGYAVEVTGPGGHHLVKVEVGLFDDADGMVQVTGNLTPGQHVVVPAL